MTNKDLNLNSNELIPFEEVVLYFIYPFVFETDNWNKINTKLKMGIPKERLGWISSQITNCSFRDQKYCWINPFNTKLSISDSNPSVAVSIDNLSSNNYNAKLKMLIRIRKSGVGTITFEIRISRKGNGLILFNELDSLFRLTPRTWTNVLRNQISTTCKEDYLSTIKFIDGKNSKSMFCLFEEALHQLRNNPKTGIKDIKFFFPKESRNSKIESNNLDSLIPPFGVYDSIEFKKVIKENYHINSPLRDTIHPYLYFTGKIDKSFYKKYFLYNNQKINSTIAKQIASILFRVYSLSQMNFLNMDFINSEIGYGKSKESNIVSEGLNSKVYTLIHRMASLSFYYSDQNDKYDDIPFCSLNPSLIDVLENTRSKWAILFHSNLILDLIIYNVKGIENLSESDLGMLFRALLKVEKLISLSLADQNILLYDGHIAFDAVKKVYEDLNVNHLSRLVQEKRTAVKSLLKNANDLKYYDLISDDFD